MRGAGSVALALTLVGRRALGSGGAHRGLGLVRRARAARRRAGLVPLVLGRTGSTGCTTGSRAPAPTLDAQLVRRAEAAIELATSGVLDPASGLLVAGAAADALSAGEHEQAGDSDDAAERESGRERPVPRVAGRPRRAGRRRRPPRATTGRLGQVLDRLATACHRAQLARRFHNQAVSMPSGSVASGSCGGPAWPDGPPCRRPSRSTTNPRRRYPVSPAAFPPRPILTAWRGGAPADSGHGQ